MKRCVFVVLAAVAIILSGCSFLPVVTGSGTPRTAACSMKGFSGIQASQTFTVRVVPGPAWSVDVTCDDNLLPYIVVDTTQNGTLRLGLEEGYIYQFITVSAEVHMPSLAMLDASGASEFDVGAGFVSARPLSISLSGASTADVAGIVCGELSVDASGASSATVAGSVSMERVVASGASRADLLNCVAASADVTLSGASEAWVDTGSGVVSLSAGGASTLYYAGNPSFSFLDLSGTSRAVKVR